MSQRMRCLAIASEMARGDRGGESSFVAQVQFAELARHMGKQRTVLYRLWDSQHDFWRDLAVYLARGDYGARPTGGAWGEAWSVDAWKHVHGKGTGASEQCRAELNDTQTRILPSAWIFLRAASLAQPDVAGVADARQQLEQDRLDAVTATFQTVADAGHRQPAPPLHMADLAAAMWCIADGLAIFNHFIPEIGAARMMLDDGDGPQSWALFSYAGRALHVECTTAQTDSSPRAATPVRRDAATVVGRRTVWTPPQRAALAAAHALILERIGDTTDTPLASLAHVTVARVARAANLSRRAVYDIWPGQTDLHLDVFRQLLSEERAVTLARLDRAMRASTGGSVLDNAIRRSEPSRPLDQILLAFLSRAHDEQVRLIARDHLAKLVAGVASRISTRVESERVSHQHLAILLLALSAGGARLQRTNPAAIRSLNVSGGRTVSTLGLAAEALLDHSRTPQ